MANYIAGLQYHVICDERSKQGVGMLLAGACVEEARSPNNILKDSIQGMRGLCEAAKRRHGGNSGLRVADRSDDAVVRRGDINVVIMEALFPQRHAVHESEREEV